MVLTDGTYLSRHNNEGYVGGVILVEGVRVGDVDASVGRPLSHFPDLLFLQFQQIHFEVGPFPFVKFYISRQAVQTGLKMKRYL